VDIQPGTYRTVDSTDTCYWERLSGFSGETADIIANEIGSGYHVVTIDPRDVGFNSQDCGVWTSDLSQVTDTDTSFGEGTYIVGTDLRPGTYGSPGGDLCYWERLRGFSGETAEIIANDLPSGQAIVTIRQSDKGFRSSGCGTWTLRP
jgi:hypothetical protein